MSTPTNAERAAWAAACIETFLSVKGEIMGPDDDIYTEAKDLITDLCHLVRREGGDPEFSAEGLCAAAADMHDTEVEEDTEE